MTHEQLETIYALARMGPTSANCSPVRIVFIQSQAAKEKLAPALSSGNLKKTLTAPVTAIIAWILRFMNYCPNCFPPAMRVRGSPPARSWRTIRHFATAVCRQPI